MNELNKKELSPFLRDGWGWISDRTCVSSEEVMLAEWSVGVWNKMGLLHPSEGGGFRRHTLGDPMPCNGDVKIDTIQRSGTYEFNVDAESFVSSSSGIWGVYVEGEESGTDVIGWRPHFATPTACNEPEQAPQFEDGKWYHLESAPSFFGTWDKRAPKYIIGLNKLYPIQEGQDWTPCNPDGSPLAFEPEVGDVYSNPGDIAFPDSHGRLNELLLPDGQTMYIVVSYLWRGHPAKTKAEAVEGLTFVRGAGE